MRIGSHSPAGVLRAGRAPGGRRPRAVCRARLWRLRDRAFARLRMQPPGPQIAVASPGGLSMAPLPYDTRAGQLRARSHRCGSGERKSKNRSPREHGKRGVAGEDAGTPRAARLGCRPSTSHAQPLRPPPKTARRDEPRPDPQTDRGALARLRPASAAGALSSPIGAGRVRANFDDLAGSGEPVDPRPLRGLGSPSCRPAREGLRA